MTQLSSGGRNLATSSGLVTNEQHVDPFDGSTVLQEVQQEYHDNTPGKGLLKKVTQVDGDTNPSTEYSYDSVGRVVQTHQSSNFGNCEFSYTVYDAAGNVVLAVCNYVATTPASDPADWEWDETNKRWEDGADNPINQGTSQDQNIITATAYDTLGRPVQVRDSRGQLTLTVYDALNCVKRTISNYVPAGTSAPEEWEFDDDAGVWQDGSNTPIDHGTDNTKNIIADTDYNDRGMIRFQRDVLGNVMLFGYDDAGRLVKTVQSASERDYNNNYSGPSPDPDLSGYAPVSDPDQDIVTEQVYDANGNLVQAIDPLGNVALTIYDALNRPIKTVRSYVAQGNPVTDPADWTWNMTNQRWEYSASDSTPIDHGSAQDQNLISTTTYDAMGRVVSARDVEGRETLSVYDALGRQTHRIINYVEQPGSDPATWTWVGSQWEDDNEDLVVHGAENDQNILTHTTYDAAGRVATTTDVQGNRTHYTYDGLGRRSRPSSTRGEGSEAAPKCSFVKEMLPNRPKGSERVIAGLTLGDQQPKVVSLYSK